MLAAAGKTAATLVAVQFFIIHKCVSSTVKCTAVEALQCTSVVQSQPARWEEQQRLPLLLPLPSLSLFLLL